VAAMNGLFRYDGARVSRVEGESTGPVYGFHDGPGGLLLGTQNGLFRSVLQPLFASKIVLDNSRALSGAAPTQLGVPTHWTMTHPCSAFADQFGLHVVATNEKGEDVATQPALGFRPRGDTMSFEATVPVTEARHFSRPNLVSRSRPRATWRLHTTILAPSSTKHSAVRRPIPLVAPVIIATFRFSLAMTCSLFHDATAWRLKPRALLASPCVLVGLAHSRTEQHGIRKASAPSTSR
jgi:hypothetical protein